MLSGVFFFPPLWNNFKLYCQDSRSLVHKNQQWLVSYLQTPFSFLVHFSLHHHDRGGPAKSSKVNWHHTVLPTVYWAIFIPFPNIVLSLKCLLQQSIIWLLSRQLTGKHHVSVLSKIYPHLFASAKIYSYKTASRKTSQVTTKSPKIQNFYFRGFYVAFKKCWFSNTFHWASRSPYVSILEYRIYIHTMVFSQIYPLGFFCLFVSVHVSVSTLHISLYLSVFQFAFV